MKIPARLVRSNLSSQLGPLASLIVAEAESGVVTLDLSDLEFIDPPGVVALSTLCLTARRGKKAKIQFEGWDPKCYLSRMKFKPMLGVKDDYPAARHLGGVRFTEILEVVTPAERTEASENICEVLGVDDPDARDVVMYALEEVLRNVDDHADSPTNAIVHGQYFPASDEALIAIADSGRGVRRSLQSRHQGLDSDEAALKEAMKLQVSGRNTRKNTNAGVGLTITAEMMKQAKGSLELYSGDGYLKVNSAGMKSGGGTGPWNGVLAILCLHRDNGQWKGAYDRAMKLLTP